MRIFMTPDPEARSIDRVLFWCGLIFFAATILLGGLLVYGWLKGSLLIYLTSAGVTYLICSTLFLVLVFVAFIGGHLGSSVEIEAPKLELFELEKKE
jgi:hypothetical protein